MASWKIMLNGIVIFSSGSIRKCEQFLRERNYLLPGNEINALRNDDYSGFNINVDVTYRDYISLIESYINVFQKTELMSQIDVWDKICISSCIDVNQTSNIEGIINVWEKLYIPCQIDIIITNDNAGEVLVRRTEISDLYSRADVKISAEMNSNILIKMPIDFNSLISVQRDGLKYLWTNIRVPHSMDLTSALSVHGISDKLASITVQRSAQKLLLGRLRTNVFEALESQLRVQIHSNICGMVNIFNLGSLTSSVKVRRSINGIIYIISSVDVSK